MSVSKQTLQFPNLKISRSISSERTWKRFKPVNPTVGVIIPTLNEEKNLPHVLPLIPKWINELILVDGRSTDNTIAVAQELWPDIRIVMETKPGKGVALRTGMGAATSDILVLLDADGSTDPAEIPVFVGALLAGADFVKGSRFLQGGGTADMELYRQWGNKGLMMLVRLLFGGHYSDLCYGYNALWRTSLADLALDCDGFEIETLMNIRALKANLTIAEVPSFEARRVHGTSNLNSLRDGYRILRTIFRELVHSPRQHTQPGLSSQNQGMSNLQMAGSSPFRTIIAADICPTCERPRSVPAK